MFVNVEKRSCEDYQCSSLISQNRPVSDLPEAETSGIFVIKEDEHIIYVGQSGDCIRERLLSHLSGYDAQNVGSYLKTLPKEYKIEHIKLGWIEIKGANFKEHHYLSCLANKQQGWPKCNLKRGRPAKNRQRTGS
ncbi:Hypothetical predicted protein [Mytilus galloprovincialis]|uniref:GIY-YIG domain-containing protein n=1 Tax=Mytilus galloprovincialis TaxID=29158 RepID=A0A8B6GLA0_MYTGA|nr:Hypothetical predicted protein [Mytilus galloprovincialis]